MSNKRRKSETRNTEPHDIIIDGLTVMTVVRNDFAELGKETETVEDLGDLPEDIPTEKEPEHIPTFEIETPISIETKFEDLLKEFHTLKVDYLKVADELHKAKFAPKKVKIDFAEMQKIIQRKSELISHLERFEEICNILESVGDVTEKGELFESSKFSISLIKKDHRGEPILKTSNSFILAEFIDFMKVKVKAKIAEIIEEIENFEI